MKKIYDKLEKSFHSYQSSIGVMECELVKYCEFGDDFSVFYQPGDGFVISYESNNAGLDLCLKVIAEKGFLSIEDYLNLTI